MLFLLRLVKLVASLRASSGVGEAPEPANLPDGGASIFSTSAHMSANIIVQKAPCPTRVSSRTLIPSSAPAITPSYPTDPIRHGHVQSDSPVSFVVVSCAGDFVPLAMTPLITSNARTASIPTKR